MFPDFSFFGHLELSLNLTELNFSKVGCLFVYILEGFGTLWNFLENYQNYQLSQQKFSIEYTNKSGQGRNGRLLADKDTIVAATMCYVMTYELSVLPWRCKFGRK